MPSDILRTHMVSISDAASGVPGLALRGSALVLSPLRNLIQPSAQGKASVFQMDQERGQGLETYVTTTLVVRSGHSWEKKHYTDLGDVRKIGK
ncbi:hypothetical protein PoB_004364500 [Plakobranchus ocellatus]|uniref:Uncharacterized protein n=1 Tax=Plakobranchus ocellatus TaxID=259542 RepID=A0AAV4B981_9GAST|nr:hypothetical protein PoB_004364500 [Plakobranchus ocellatus]